ncbi:MAG: lysophospholipid acyltransferase family protein [Alphaproteobacteria bacterium]|nr:lysophospholipid acyltransferase family protein [Alphaproteobacteria bacterium]
MLKNISKNILRSRFVEGIIGSVAFWYLKFVGMTTRWEVSGVKETYEALDKYGSMIVIGWHGRTLEMPYFWNKKSKLNALVSPHRDGRLIVNILRKFGIGNIDGSTDRDSAKAALSLMNNLRQGNSIAIIPDGPRGPSMTLGMSPLFYAQKSGKPIMGISYSIAGSYVVKQSWDHMLVPFPFRKGMYTITKPLIIPKDATAEELENYRRKLEDELNNVTWEMDKKMGIPYIPKGNSKKSRKEIG